MNGVKINRLQHVRFMLRQLKAYRIKMILSILCGILKESCLILGVGVCAYLVGLAAKGGTPGSTGWIPILILCAVGRGVFTYLESFLSHDVAYRALVDYRMALYERFETLCPDILLKERSGQVATTLMNDVEQLEWFYGHTAGQIVTVLVVCTAVTVFLWRLHPALGLFQLVSMCLIATIPFWMRGRSDAQGAEVRFRLGEANSVTLEGVNGINEILTLNWRDAYREKSRRYMGLLTKTQVAYARRMGVEGALLLTAVGAAAVLITMIAIWLTLNGTLSREWYMVVSTSAWLAFGPLMEICIVARSFGNVFAASERVAKILTAEPLVQDSGTETDLSALEPSVRFDHVSFSYTEGGGDVLRDVSFAVRPSETVALVGESGAGKTTCIRLLTRLWDVKKGCVSIGGTDVRRMKLSDVHSLSSVVLQDVYLFNTSIRENIRLGAPSASDEEVMEAARMAKIHDFICSLPQGYDTVTGERGVQLSGGQRQRIAIARAMLKDSPILILDEAVSNLDTKTDMEIQETIRNLSHKKTMIIVAHRLSTVREADRLIVLRHGRVVQQGPPDELMTVPGYYHDLISSQLEERSSG